MARALSAAVLVLAVLLPWLTPVTTGGAEPGCPAIPVDEAGGRVRIGPFRGEIATAYDVVNGRFRLRVGGLRDPGRGLTQKIPWFAPVRSGVGESLEVSGRRLEPTPRRFRQRFASAGTSDTRRHVYPSILRPPAAGCWRFTFRSGRVRASAVVLVSPRPR